MAISKYDKKFEYGKILTEGDLNGMVDAINRNVDGINNVKEQSDEAVRIANVAKNAVATLEGLSNATTAEETLAALVVKVEEHDVELKDLSDLERRVSQSESESLAVSYKIGYINIHGNIITSEHLHYTEFSIDATFDAIRVVTSIYNGPAASVISGFDANGNFVKSYKNGSMEGLQNIDMTIDPSRDGVAVIKVSTDINRDIVAYKITYKEIDFNQLSRDVESFLDAAVGAEAIVKEEKYRQANKNGQVVIRSGYYGESNGEYYSHSGYTCSESFIAAEKYVKFRYSYMIPMWVSYYSDDNVESFISSQRGSKTSDFVFPEGTKYITFSLEKAVDLNKDVEVFTDKTYIDGYEEKEIQQVGFIAENGSINANSTYSFVMFKIGEDEKLVDIHPSKKTPYFQYSYYKNDNIYLSENFLGYNKTGVVLEGTKYVVVAVNTTNVEGLTILRNLSVKRGSILTPVKALGLYGTGLSFSKHSQWGSTNLYYAEEDIAVNIYDKKGGLITSKTDIFLYRYDLNGNKISDNYNLDSGDKIYRIRVQKGCIFNITFPMAGTDSFDFEYMMTNAISSKEGLGVAWYGTSIPAGTGGLSYPNEVAGILKSLSFNHSIGGSELRCRYMDGSTKATSNTDGTINNYGILSSLSSSYKDIETKCSEAGVTDSSQIAAQKKNSFEHILVAKYLDTTSSSFIELPDAVVIDHGFNDYQSGIDTIEGTDYFLQEPTQAMVNNGILVADTQIELADGTTLSIPVWQNRNTFIGAMNFLISIIKKYQPNMKILIVSTYYNGEDNKYNCKTINQAIEYVAKKWQIPICRQYEFNHLNTLTINGVSQWTYLLPDNIHPRNEYNKLVANGFAEKIKEL